ncbi:hypothetical protein OAV80_01870, partial [Candidatus Pseudothioglobus singularis]|nr:hypothetical protein [Candidatus Pseudothioglobus singularis]
MLTSYKKLLILLLSLGVLTSSYADFFDGWTDDNLCGWMQNPSPPANIKEETEKRGLTCSAGKATNASSVSNKTSSNEVDKTSSSAPKKVTNKLGYPDGELREPKKYSIFSSQASYFKKLVSNGMYLSAQRLFDKHRYNYFTKKSAWGEVPYDNLKKEFLEVANGVLATFEPEVQLHLDAMQVVNSELKKSKSIPESKWSEYRKLLDENAMMSRNYKSNKLVEYLIRKERKFNPSLKNKVYKEGEKFKSLAKEYADSAFGKYDLINNENFFNLYPVRLSAKEKKKLIDLNSKYILSELDKASTSKANIVIKDYRFDTFKTTLRLDLISRQFNKADIFSNNDLLLEYKLTGGEKITVINKSAEYILSEINSASAKDISKLIERYNLNDPKISFSGQLSGILLNKSIGDKKNLTVLDVYYALKNLSVVKGASGKSELLMTTTVDDDQGLKSSSGGEDQDPLSKKYEIAVFKVTSENAKEPRLIASSLLKTPTKSIDQVVKSPYIIAIQSRIESLNRTDDDVKKVQSQYKSSSSMVRNSSYSSAQSAVQRAENKYQSVLRDFNELKAWKANGERNCKQQAESSNRGTANCSGNIDSNGYFTSSCTEGNSYSSMTYSSCMSGVNLALALGDYNGKYNRGTKALQNAKSTLNRANSKLASTPSQVSKDNFSSYSFSTRKFEVTKNIERVIFLINRDLNTYSVFTIPHIEKKSFLFSTGLDRNDKSHRQNEYQNDDDVEIFVTKPDSFSIEQLIAQIPKEHKTNELKGTI